MINYYITIALIAIVYSQLFHITKDIKKKAYQWWYLPWFSLVYSGLMYVIYNLTDFPSWPFISTLFEGDFQAEATYSLLCIAIWLFIRLFIREDSIHKSLIKPFRQLFAKDRDDKEKVLPFPYYIDEEEVVRGKVGQTFYRLTTKSFIICIAIVYILFFILFHYNIIEEFYLASAFGILGLMPLMEFYIYLCAEVPAEKEIIEDEKIGQSDFDELWQLYVDTFNNYSVAWKKTSSPEEREIAMKKEKGNDNDFDDLINDFMDKEKHPDIIIEKYDIVSAFLKLKDIFDYVESNGHHILIALDIPNHFTKNQEKSFTDEIAAKLTEIMRKNFNVYKKESAQTALSNSIVVSSLSLLSRQGLNEEWMRKIGLITVVNVFDKGVSNMYECRKFCYILQSVNKNYQLVFIAPHRRGIEPSLKNTWLTSTNVTEKKKNLFFKGVKRYFIGYNFEEFKDRLNKILIASPNEPLYSGSEMALIALSSRTGAKEKAITPIHYFDLAYSNAIESKEELNKYSDLIRNTYDVSKDNINNNLINHLLPIDQLPEKQVLTTIYDVENNAPAAYSKWVHLGLDENFSIIISKPYLFRDYFNANHDYFVIAPFVGLQPHLCKSRLTLAIILLNMLKKAEMEENNLRELLLYYFNESDIVSVSGIIRDLFKTYFSSDLASMLMTKEEVSFKSGEYLHQLKYDLFQLTDANTPPYLNIVTVKDESGNVLFDLLYDLMYQNYDNGQTHSFSGKPYIIKDFNKATKTLNVSSTNNSSNDILFYKAVQEITLSGNKIPIEGMDLSPTKWHHEVTGEWISIHFEGFETDIRVKTVEWYEFYKYTLNGCRISMSNSPERHYPNGKVLKITFGYMKKDAYQNKINDIRKSLQVLLYEAMQSVFPHHAQYLIISSIGDQDNDLPWIFNHFVCDDQQKNNELSYYFIEDAHVDLGLIGALVADKENIWYILRYIYDYLIWLTETNTGTSSCGNNDDNNHDILYMNPTVYDQYLERENLDKFTFLKYGRDHLPSYFDIDLLINFIKDLFEESSSLQKTNIERQTKIDVTGSCDFCGRKMKNSEMTRLDDGRMRCPDCSKDAIDSNEQFLDLCKQVRDAFQTYLSIDFSSITYHAELVSAVELHKLGDSKFNITNGYDIRKFIGLAFDTTVDVFYVENGYQPEKTFGIIAHEMTHIWEYNDKDFCKVRKTNEDIVEGLAVWTDLFLSEKSGANNIESRRKGWLARDDEYGRGLRFIMENCPDDPYGYIHEKAKNL